MTMTQFQVDTARIQSGTAEIESLSARLDADVQTMMNRLASLQDAWRGSAAGSFQEVMTRWQGTQRQVRAGLDDIRSALGRAGTRYAEVEAANSALFRL